MDKQEVATPERRELSTSDLEGRRSIQMSYGVIRADFTTVARKI
jgi:hypothetical protein